MEHQEHHEQGHHGSWGTFFAMIATATVVMFFLMYQLVYADEHLFFSINRAVSSLVSGAVMTMIMLAFMWKMYGPKNVKVMVMVAAAVAAVGILWLNRSQTLIGDSEFMESMIPHHSIAINNARKSSISDPRVRKLADEIIEAQVKEIAQMELLLEDIQTNGERGNGDAMPPRTAELTPELFNEAKEAIERPLTDEAREEVEVSQ